LKIEFPSPEKMVLAEPRLKNCLAYLILGGALLCVSLVQFFLMPIGSGYKCSLSEKVCYKNQQYYFSEGQSNPIPMDEMKSVHRIGPVSIKKLDSYQVIVVFKGNRPQESWLSNLSSMDANALVLGLNQVILNQPMAPLSLKTQPHYASLFYVVYFLLAGIFMLGSAGCRKQSEWDHSTGQLKLTSFYALDKFQRNWAYPLGSIQKVEYCSYRAPNFKTCYTCKVFLASGKKIELTPQGLRDVEEAKSLVAHINSFLNRS
jgi:hypothetical protein